MGTAARIDDDVRLLQVRDAPGLSVEVLQKDFAEAAELLLVDDVLLGSGDGVLDVLVVVGEEDLQGVFADLWLKAAPLGGNRTEGVVWSEGRWHDDLVGAAQAEILNFDAAFLAGFPVADPRADLHLLDSDGAVAQMVVLVQREDQLAPGAS